MATRFPGAVAPPRICSASVLAVLSLSMAKSRDRAAFRASVAVVQRGRSANDDGRRRLPDAKEVPSSSASCEAVPSLSAAAPPSEAAAADSTAEDAAPPPAPPPPAALSPAVAVEESPAAAPKRWRDRPAARAALAAAPQDFSDTGRTRHTSSQWPARLSRVKSAGFGTFVLIRVASYQSFLSKSAIMASSISRSLGLPARSTLSMNTRADTGHITCLESFW